jgi:polysaccharide export outer membrane protein
MEVSEMRQALVWLAALLLVWGCGHRPDIPPQTGPAAEGSGYVIGQGDQIEVQVWEEPDLSRQAVVGTDGRLYLPLGGDLQAEGLGVARLRELITERYRGYVADPVVSVLVSNPASATFFVTGRVATPGEYPLRKETTVLQAVAIAGGFTEWAKTGRLALVRRGGERLELDYEAIVRGEGGQNLKLWRGDTLVVP